MEKSIIMVNSIYHGEQLLSWKIVECREDHRSDIGSGQMSPWKSATITLSLKVEDSILSFNKWYQILVRSFDQKKNNKSSAEEGNGEIKLNKNMLFHYKAGLSQVEGRLVEFKNQEIKLGEKIRVLEFSVECKTNRIECLTNELELLKKEKEGLESKLTGLPEFADDTITEYTRPSSSVESNPDDLQNNSSSASENGESTGSILSKPEIKFVRPADSPTVVKTDKKEYVRKPTVKYAEIYRKPTERTNVRGNQRNWNNLKSQQLGNNFVMKKACYNCGAIDHLSYDYRKRMDQGSSWGKNNNTHKSKTPRTVFHKSYRPPMRPKLIKMHNDIMAAGSKERPPVLASDGDRPRVPGYTKKETYAKTSPENKKLIDDEAKVVHMILLRMENDIYSTINACPNAKEIWIAIERLQQGESINIQDFRNQWTVAVAGNMETIGNQHSEQPESIYNTYVVEKVDSNVIPDSTNICENKRKDEQNAEEPRNEHVLLASLIANLKLDVDENKKIQKQLKKVVTPPKWVVAEYRFGSVTS
nr:RNA-directed DNA polymerase, eukaryota [Tanacetum cinerariifolium]